MIFKTKHTKAVPYTHSCNFKKPWCLQCPKCLYVWLGYAAFLSKELVTATFGDENVFDVDDNQPCYRQLLDMFHLSVWGNLMKFSYFLNYAAVKATEERLLKGKLHLASMFPRSYITYITYITIPNHYSKIFRFTFVNLEYTAC